MSETPMRRIVNRWDGRVLWEGPAATVKDALHAALASGADLTRADLTRADLTDADLTDADLTDADLTRANLTRANLTDADLTSVRDDIWAVLSSAPADVPALIAALRDGRIDGSVYSGDCCCLVGTLAKAHGCDVYSLPGLQPNSYRPAEMWFLGIRPGDTPETNQQARLALEWAEDWLARVRGAFAVTA